MCAANSLSASGSRGESSATTIATATPRTQRSSGFQPAAATRDPAPAAERIQHGGGKHDEQRRLDRPCCSAGQARHGSGQIEDDPREHPDAGQEGPVERERLEAGADERQRIGDVVPLAFGIAGRFTRPGQAARTLR